MSVMIDRASFVSEHIVVMNSALFVSEQMCVIRSCGARLPAAQVARLLSGNQSWHPNRDPAPLMYQRPS